MPPFLRPYPLNGPPLPVIFLDVDGVLNRMPAHIRQGRSWVSVPPSNGYWIDVDHVAIASLDALFREFSGRCELVWLTTWGREVVLLEDVLRGTLRGGFVTAERPMGRFVAMSWKLNALVAHLADRDNPPFVWIDDEAISDAVLSSPDFAGGKNQGGEPRLLIEPKPGDGITLEHIAAIRAFLDQHAPRM